jgi:hypothetical protein
LTRSLRARHRAAILALGLLVPGLFAAALVARRPPPDPTAPLEVVAPGLPDVIHEAVVDLAEYGPLALRVHRAAGVASGFDLTLSRSALDGPPDLLAYWTAGAVDSLDRAVLLGQVAPGASVVRLPGAAATRSGTLLFYSLAHRSLVATAPLSALASEPES